MNANHCMVTGVSPAFFGSTSGLRSSSHRLNSASSPKKLIKEDLSKKINLLNGSKDDEEKNFYNKLRVEKGIRL